eukprot:TRINITY_DN72441_c0_g1_i1.p1 TRINITY_DN72441_c0_g1~~TRINITY_DN72441_c0_g1_i1.p1  ORF type:complete len:231 (-),score=27.77 TRINITY_DN72441_c0_g1_i1:182-874(-)
MLSLLGFCCSSEQQDGVVHLPNLEVCESYAFTSVFRPREPAESEPNDLGTKGGIFEAQLDMAVGDSLGMLLDSTDDDHGPMIIDFSSDGMVAKYNATCTSKPMIELFDRIEAVNGRPCFGMASQMTLKTAAKGPKMNLLIRRPMRLHVTLDKACGTPLGVNMTYKQGSYGVLIKSIHTHGLFNDWNEAHPEAMVTIGDRVIEMLEEKVKNHELIALMKTKMQFTLVVMHF